MTRAISRPASFARELAAGLAALAMLGLSGCGGSPEVGDAVVTPPASTPVPAPTPSAEKPAETPADAVDPAVAPGDPPKTAAEPEPAKAP